VEANGTRGAAAMSARPTRRPWAEWELRELRELYPDLLAETVAAELRRSVRSVYQMAAKLGLRKSAEFQERERERHRRRNEQTPALLAGRFSKGFVPWNKGMKGLQYEGSRATQFKPGQRRGAAERLWVPIGTHRISKDGYLEVKVRDAGHGAKNFEAVHRIVWADVHGPVPAGHIVVFRSGRRTNVLERITPDALECISRAENARRNHPRTRDPELGRLVALKGAITRQVNRIQREAEQT